MIRFLLSTTLVISIFGLTSCTEIFVPDLSTEKVILLAPEDSATISSIGLLFLWEKVEGADSYRLQVVRPDFNTPHFFALDTPLAGTDFTYSFVPGSYQWRVKALSSSSETDYSVRTVFIDSTSDLSSAQTSLSSPQPGWYNTTTHDFSWLPVFLAQSYVYSLFSPNASGGALIHQEETENVALSYTLQEGLYEWGVSARNNQSQSPYTFREIKIDTTSPSAPVLSSPVDGAVLISDTIIFVWDNSSAGTGAPLFDSIYVSLDAQGNQPILRKQSISGGTTDSLGTGFYYWKVRRFDEAGNSSGFTSTRSFQVAQ